MTELKTSTQTLDFDDEIALHLLVETAIFDSSGYELLTHEEVDRLKREQTTLTGRIEALRRKLLLETKVRDAAQSLSRLRSPKQNESPLDSPISAFGSSFNRPGHDSMAQASVELSASITKCHEIDAEIRKLEADLWALDRRILCHTSRVLATTYHHAEKLRHHAVNNIDPPSLRSSTPNKFTKYQAAKPLEDFDDRSFYKPAIGSGETPPSRPEFRTSGAVVYTTDPRAPSALSNDSLGLNHAASVVNMETVDLPQPLNHQDQSTIAQRLVALNDILRATLVQIEGSDPEEFNISKELISEENKVRAPGSAHNSTPSALEEVSTLERGLEQVRAFVFHQRGEPISTKFDDRDLLPIWEVLLDWERRYREDSDGDGKSSTEIAQEGDGLHDSGPGVLGKDDMGIKGLTDKVRSLTDTSSRWAADKRDLRLQLRQKSRENEMEIQKHEDTKADHEQQIMGLTNSLSNALGELSQVSSKQDANGLLKQEALKLREELDTREQHHAQQIGELQIALSSQRTNFENRVNDAQAAAQERERGLKEELRILREEVLVKNQALDDSIAMAGTGDQKARELEEKVGYLHSQLEKSQAAKIDGENRSYLDKQNLESLAESLRVREARAEALEQNLAEMAASKNRLEEMYKEETTRVEVLDQRGLDLQNQLRSKDALVAEQTSNVEELKLRLTESQAAKKNLESNVSTLENEVQQLLTELATLADDLKATKAYSQQQIEEAKQQAAAKIQIEQGKSQPAMDANLFVELEKLSKQNEDLRKENFVLQNKISESEIPRGGVSTGESRALQERCDRLQKELDDMLVDYEVLMKDSVDFEADKSRLESQVDALQDKVETLERSLADERMGNGQPVKLATLSSNSLVAPPVQASGENMTISVLRTEFKKMMRDMRMEHNRTLRGEQEARRRLENELRHVRRDQSNSANSKPGA
ncbi:hypothetical protein TWF481_007197 [Arthrobotrys musiformis]|uniref:Up-regulated during septation protein 1 domain-containing protein n=1 Tax=Arthrobotrys musiformis TaxID=47236 RepID=A0AAV9WAR9_9PEZI